jgi:two-component sensor histidine kinase/PAS domain-containing protein
VVTETLENPSPEELARIVSSSGLIVCFTPDIASDLLWSPGGFLTPLGYARGELTPGIAAYFDKVHPEDRLVLEQHRALMVASSDIVDIEVDYRMRHASGCYVWVRSITSAGARAPDGTRSAFAVTRVIGQHQRLECARPGRQADPLHAVMNEIGQPVVLMTADGLIVQANAAAGRAAGATELAVGTPCPYLHAPGLPRAALAAMEAAVDTGTRQRLELHRFDRWWDMHLVPIRDANGAVAQVLLLASDVSELKALERQRLESASALTAALVREVHHRIKNHLQGLVGLLRLHQGRNRAADEVIQKAIEQVQSIATVHGLLVRQPEEGVDLDVILRDQPNRLAQDHPDRLRFETQLEPDVTADLASEDAVAVALVIGELITNAAKHTRSGPGAHVSVELRKLDEDTVGVSVRNGPATLPADFSLQRCQGSGGGLDLIQSLLPQGSRLGIETRGDEVIAQLRLRRAGREPAPRPG